MSQFGTQFIRDFAKKMRIGNFEPNLDFCENGYLFLAATEQQEQTLRANYDIQISCGAEVVLMEPSELVSAFPHLNVEDVRLASFGRSGEGWFSNTGIMDGFRMKAIEQGASWIIGEVCGLSRQGTSIGDVTLANGDRIACGAVVNAAGTRAACVASMAELDLPVEPRKRSVFLFRCAQSPQGTAAVNNGSLPLMIDSSGTYCRPEGTCFLMGMSPKIDSTADLDDFQPCYSEFEENWANIAHRSVYFEAIKLIRCWAGHYDFNTLDQNAIVGPHNEVGNFYFANGFSGHGLQQAPAVGRGLSELIVHREFRTLDLSQLGYERIANSEPFVENAII